MKADRAMQRALTPAQVLALEQRRAISRALESAMELQLRANALLSGLAREHRFDLERRWRLDFAWPAQRVALEVDGGTTWGRGAHSRGAGYDNDCEKDAAAQLAGWIVFRATSRLIHDGSAAGWVREALHQRSLV